jgi:P2 family phage contractile tail tube protein
MAIPRFLKGFDVTINAFNFRNKCEEITLPKLAIKTEEWRGSGMDAPIEIDMGMEKLEATLKFYDLTEKHFLAFGIKLSDEINGIIISGSVQAQGEAAIPIIINLNGWIKEMDFGTWKTGELSSGGTTLQLAVDRYTMLYGGVPLVNIDVMNGKRIISGFDQTASAQRAFKLL